MLQKFKTIKWTQEHIRETYDTRLVNYVTFVDRCIYVEGKSLKMDIVVKNL